MTQLQQQVQAVRNRQQRQWLWQCVSAGMLTGGVVACILGFVRLQNGGTFSWIWMATVLVAGPLTGFLWAQFKARSLKNAAVAIDQAYRLKDRTQSALHFGKICSPTGDASAVHRLQMADAEQHAATVQPEIVVPTKGPKAWPLAVSLTVAAVVLAMISGPPADLSAAEVANDVVSDQADRIEAGLEELKVLKEEQSEPELKELVQELEQLIEQLKLPGMDPKEALAKLSEMEASLQQMQEQLDLPQSAAELQKVGEALSLSESMAQAGAALAKGELDKAAEHLEKLEMPKLDRSTEKAITEKLDQLNQNPGDGSPKKSIQEAASQISQGLGQGNRSKFSDGMKGLAGEARKQGRKKKLSDLLKKQCQCLSECKCECEGECRSQTESLKKGGNKAGSAASGNPSGDKTALLKAQPKINLKGEESAQGDVDTETETSDAQQQEAVRNYRQKADEYEALSESVLESESIPLGHRQTIRRYFQLIRPSSNETDAVNQQTESP